MKSSEQAKIAQARKSSDFLFSILTEEVSLVWYIFQKRPDVFFSQFSMIFLIPFTTGFSHSECNWRPEVKMFCSCAIIERAFLDLDKCRWRKINVVPCLNPGGGGYSLTRG